MPPWASKTAREHRDAGRGQHADGVAVGAGRHGAGGQRRLEERAGTAGVASDDESHAVHAVVELERRHQLARNPERQLGRQRLLVRHAPDSVGAEQAGHRVFSGFARARAMRLALRSL